MNNLEVRLKELSGLLYSKFVETKEEVELLLDKYAVNFPAYTDHSIYHTWEVFQIAADLMTANEIAALGADEVYILSMACILHDIGMCIPPQRIDEIAHSDAIELYRKTHRNQTTEEFIRDIHHQLSNRFIQHEWQSLKIPNENYALAIGIVSEGHRKVELGNFEVYKPQFFAKSGREFACLPYLASILRIADELDVTNSRTPKLLRKFYMPDNEISIREWNKHISTSQRNFKNNEVIFQVKCSDHKIYAALQDQFEKIQNVINYCQKVIRSIPFLQDKHYSLNLSVVKPEYKFIGFDPKGIRFSFDVQNVVKAFIGEDLYKDKLTALREAIQNAVDSCRYKTKVLDNNYSPKIRIKIEKDFIEIEDNGAGMDEFIIENFFGRLGSSYYEQEKIKSQFEAIGQFGVGVFSYFLLSEYVDIETKTEKSNALAFRFDKDPKSYFHFFDNASRTSSGTNVRMYLKENIKGTMSDQQIEKFVRKVFKHLEFPIELSVGTTVLNIEDEGFEIDAHKEIKDRITLLNKSITKQLEIQTVVIDNEDLEGVCGIIVGKKEETTFSFPEKILDVEQFYTVDHGHARSQVAFSQKGVFVNNYSSETLNFLIGDINLKKKIKINIDRNEFSDASELQILIQKFKIAILTKIFNTLTKSFANDQRVVKMTNDFLSNYSLLRYERTAALPEYVNLLKQYSYFNVFDGKSWSIKSLNTIVTQFPEFNLITEPENAEEVFSYFHIPVLKVSGVLYSGPFLELVSIFTNYLSIPFRTSFANKKGYVTFSKDIEEEYFSNLSKLNSLLDNRYYEIIKSGRKEINLNIWKNKKEFRYYDDENFINYDHFFVQFIISNYEIITLDSRYSKILRTAFQYIMEIARKPKVTRSEIRKLNEILEPVVDLNEMPDFKQDDFM